MAYRVTGIGALGLSLNWEKVDGDKQIAQRVVSFLEDRRILYFDFHAENESFCVQSANAAREFLTEQLGQAKPGKSLASSLKAMRSAFRHFVDVGGSHGENFWKLSRSGSMGPLSMALGELRGRVGLHVALISYYYGLEVEDDLAAILPQLEAEDLRAY
jgi:hypothetical protein